jgi:membrane-bound lytic murein transglycosylase D
MPKNFELRVPADALEQPIDVALASIPGPQRFAVQHRDRLYTVRRGDSLSKIARKYGVKERELVALNNLRSRHRIRAGQVLVLPDEPGARAPIARMEPPADGIYHVRRGDTISRIAARFGLTESSLVALNGLRNRHQIAVGQRLLVSASASAQRPTPKIEEKVASAAPTPTIEEKIASAAPAPEAVERAAPKLPTPKEAQPIAPTSDSAAEDSIEVASNSRVEDSIEVASNSRVEDSIEVASNSRVEDSIEVASVEIAETLVGELASQAPTVASVVIPAPDPSDYSVSDGDRITVQANETLGHYADWLEVPTSRLRRLNGIRYGTPVGIGRPTKLDFSVVSRETFEQRRLEYHHTLQEEFFDVYEVVGTDTHRLKKGDTLWELAEKRFRVPVWLLRQYNPTLDFSALQAGARLTVPRIAPRAS